LSGEEVKAAVRLKNYAELVRYDQLTQQRENGNVGDRFLTKPQPLHVKAFAEFDEGLLNFSPTYKYDTFSDDYVNFFTARCKWQPGKV
jgi:phosphatidylinositol-bisphosphatase